MPLEIATESDQQDELDESETELPDDRAPLAAVTLALWRFGRSLRLLLTVGLGMLVAVILLCTVPLYSSLVSEVQLQQLHQAEDPAALNLEVATALQSAISANAVQQQAVDDPLASGMTGLLLTGAALAVVLALLGSVVQASVAAGQRRTQFAILRTLGGGRAQLISILLAQQTVVFGFGLVVGSALGVMLATATLPFLQFSTAALNTTAQRLPPFLLAFNLAALSAFYAALLLAFAVALYSGLQVARRAGLGQAIRLGED